MLGGYCMSTTLTNGLKLPDKGSVDWYADMQSNYTILDGAVGTIAAHTSALSGKAPLVHTHTKSDITDFPAYGNAAGTICEGNDSRLSDARTPVAHTHTKSDVTNLLNSDFIPSANNSYDLGSSSYQWNNLYAKNYYYNGVEFQNKFVTLDTGQTITGTKTFSSNILSKNYNYSRGTVPSTSQYNTYAFRDNSNNTTARLLRWFNTDGYNGLTLQSWDAQLTTDTSVFFQLQYDSSGNGQATIGGNNFKEFDPLTNNSIDLGTSSRKWKTLNGINPGALSLPTNDSTKWVDLSGSIPASPSKYTYTPTVNGWISVMAKKSGGEAIAAVFLIQGNISNACYNKGSTLVGENAIFISACIPVRAGVSADIHIKGSGTIIESAYFMPCEGNV